MVIDNKIEKTFSGPLVIMAYNFYGRCCYFNIYISLYFRSIKFYYCMFSIIYLFRYINRYRKTNDKTLLHDISDYSREENGSRWKDTSGLTLVPMQKVYSIYSRSNRR